MEECTYLVEGTQLLTRHVRSFATVLTGREGERPPDWLDAVRQDDLPSFHTLAAGIGRDRNAVIAGLTLHWNSGAVEGHVNWIKMIKTPGVRPGSLRPPAEASPTRTMTGISVS
ncbi:hypothetical protein ACFWA8_11910 [Streptomyces celluloflavus]|uniref:hypothetical protein n=1 Tax=Streptomyces celluloflavus TaxID=58344 RepID=UPI003662DC3F